jgi:hypothetical protein
LLSEPSWTTAKARIFPPVLDRLLQPLRHDLSRAFERLLLNLEILRLVRREGTREVTRLIDHYNLEAILAVGT